MVRALLAGTKTQTRRIVKPNAWVTDDCDAGYDGQPVGVQPYIDIYRCPYGRLGDRLWVRETAYYDEGDGRLPKLKPEGFDPSALYYRADGECCEQIPECACAEVGKPRWTPSIHMPRWASRIALEITGVRVERLQEISRGDAMAEGCPHPNMQQGPNPRVWYADLWDGINGAGSWNANPWVWVVSFKRVTP
jgi:hypothetical protein